VDSSFLAAQLPSFINDRYAFWFDKLVPCMREVLLE
jgi:hypothetical protein